MMKKLYFCETNGYNMIVSVDEENNCRYLTETNDFPHIDGMDAKNKEKTAIEFLNTVEDDSSWEDNCEFNQIFIDGIEVLSEIERDI